MMLMYGVEIGIPKEFLPKEELEAIDGLAVFGHQEFAIIGIHIRLGEIFNLSKFNFEEEAKLHHEKVLDAVQVLLSSLSKKAQNGEEIPDLPEEINFDWYVIDEKF